MRGERLREGDGLLLIFDLDGTLIEHHEERVPCPLCHGAPADLEDYTRQLCPACNGTSTKPFHVQATYLDVKALPGRQRALAHHAAAGHRLAIATNQTDVGFGRITDEVMEERITRAWDLFPAVEFIVVACDHPGATDPRYRQEHEIQRRKPNPGMLLECMEEFGAHPRNVTMIGDRTSDRVAATRAGVHFEWAEIFFSKWQPKEVAA